MPATAGMDPAAHGTLKVRNDSSRHLIVKIWKDSDGSEDSGDREEMKPGSRLSQRFEFGSCKKTKTRYVKIVERPAGYQRPDTSGTTRVLECELEIEARREDGQCRGHLTFVSCDEGGYADTDATGEEVDHNTGRITISGG